MAGGYGLRRKPKRAALLLRQLVQGREGRCRLLADEEAKPGGRNQRIHGLLAVGRSCQGHVKERCGALRGVVVPHEAALPAEGERQGVLAQQEPVAQEDVAEETMAARAHRVGRRRKIVNRPREREQRPASVAGDEALVMEGRAIGLESVAKPG